MMNPLHLCLLMVAITPSVQQSDPCHDYTVLNDPWRATTNQDQSALKCDRDVQWQGWYLMVHQGVSVRMPNVCVPKNRCGAEVPLWLRGSYPKPEDGIVPMEVCGNWVDGCCHFKSTSIRVKACPGDYTVYEFRKPVGCSFAYCADLSYEGGDPTNTTPTPPTPSTPPMPANHVICMETFMAIELEKSTVIGVHEDHLRLNDPSCTLYSNGTHVLANMSLTACGTVMEDDGENIIFRNTVVSFDDLADIIIRRHDVEIEFYCKYPKESTVVVQFDAHRPPLNFIEKGFGAFTYQFEFFESDQFTQEKDPDTYPLEFDLGDMMYMQIESIPSLSNMELFAESCSAAPNDDPDERLSYSIIENGCQVDETVQMYSNNQSKVQLAMKAFKFIGLHDQVFITCSVVLCKAGVPGSRCSQGCTNSSASGHHIGKREAPIQTAKHYISQGPLRLRRDLATANKVARPTLNLNLAVVVGGLLAAVAMVCGVLVYKTGGSEVKYKRVPSP